MLLSLLPLQPPTLWPETFVSQKVGEAILEQRNKADEKASVCITYIHSSLRLGTIQDYNPLDPSYPAHRRQQRLSFSAAYLLESGDEPDKTLFTIQYC
jgi:ABC-type arginine transport system ATPase subunit